MLKSNPHHIQNENDHMKVLGANNLPNSLRHETESNHFVTSEQQMGELINLQNQIIINY